MYLTFLKCHLSLLVFFLGFKSVHILKQKSYAHCLNMIHKSFIFSVKWINLADLRMPPSWSICPAGSSIRAERRWKSNLRQATGSIRGGLLTCLRSNRCQVGSEASWAAWDWHCAHQCSCCQLSWVRASRGGAGSLDRMECACVYV